MEKRFLLPLLSFAFGSAFAQTPPPSQELLSLSPAKEVLEEYGYEHILNQGYSCPITFGLYDFRVDIHQPDLFLEQLSQTAWGKSHNLSSLFPHMGVKSMHLISSSNGGLNEILEPLMGPMYVGFSLLSMSPTRVLNGVERGVDGNPYSEFHQLWEAKMSAYYKEKLKNFRLSPVLLQIRLEKDAPILVHYQAILSQLGKPLHQGNGMSTWRLDNLIAELPMAWQTDAEGKARELYLTLVLKDDVITAFLASGEHDHQMLRDMKVSKDQYTKAALRHEGHFLSMYFTDALQDKKDEDIPLRMAKEVLLELIQSDKEHAADYQAVLRYLEKLEKQLHEFTPNLSGEYEIEAWYDGDINLSYTLQGEELYSFQENKRIISDSMLDSPVTLAFAEMSGISPPAISISVKDVEEGERALMRLGKIQSEEDLQFALVLVQRGIDVARGLNYSGGVYASHDADSVAGYLGLANKESFLKGVDGEYKPLGRVVDGERYDLLFNKACLLNEGHVFIGNNIQYVKLLDSKSKENQGRFTGLRAAVLFNKPTNLFPFYVKVEGLEAFYMTIDADKNKLKGRAKLVLSR